jgi:hypothetical protein
MVRVHGRNVVVVMVSTRSTRQHVRVRMRGGASHARRSGALCARSSVLSHRLFPLP